ncbi:MAG: exo-alpha-sialidase, partial [Bryobacterales bacterium]|nr:exo-alpha-sialidase [Bryobacterales bacterium]
MNRRTFLTTTLAATAAAQQQEDRMFAVPGLPEDPAAIDWNRLPVLQGETIRVFAGTAGESAYNNHAYLEHFDGRFWAMWSCHPTDGNFHGMHLRYATSRDGRNWSEAKLLSPIPKGERYVARGLWVRNGELLALASLDSGRPRAQPTWAAPDLRLVAFDWRGGRWRDLGLVHGNTLNNFPPKRLPNGQWAMARRDYQFNLSLMFGGVKAFDQWEIREVPNREDRRFNEPDFIVRADGSVAMHIRDGGNSRRLYRAVSTDGGNTWSNPVRTNFPDANAKNF